MMEDLAGNEWFPVYGFVAVAINGRGSTIIYHHLGKHVHLCFLTGQEKVDTDLAIEKLAMDLQLGKYRPPRTVHFDDDDNE